MADKSLLSGRESDRIPQHASKQTARAAEVSAGLSAGSLATIVVFGTIFFVGGVAFIGLYLARRRASARNGNEQDVSSFDHSYNDVEESIATRRKKLQKKPKKEWPLTFEATEIILPVRKNTAPPQIPPLFPEKSRIGSLFGKISPTKSVKTPKSWKPTTWIDEDNLHGPKMSDVRDVNGQPFSRDSWPLYTFTPPNMPTVTTEHVHPYYRGLYQQQHMAQAQMIAAQPYIPPAGPRQLPIPPRPALVTSNWVASTTGPAGYYTLQDLVKNGRAPTTNVPQKLVPEKTAPNRSRSRSRSRSRHRPSRQSSTDSTLSEILKSTEQRLAERSPSKSRSPTKSGNTSSRETLLARSDKPTDDTASCQLCRSCSASPTKSSPDQAPPLPQLVPQPASSSAPGHNRSGSDSSAFGHRRGGSDSSAVSEPDSLIDEFQMMPAGLTSPSRTPRSQGTPEQSPANSVSSGLPTLYSESEAEEDDGSPLKPTIYNRATMRHVMPSNNNNDPFTSPAASPERTNTPSRDLPQPLAQQHKVTAGSRPQSSFKDPTSPTALQSHFAAQLREAASSSSSPNPQRSSQPAYLNLLPLDLYQLCTPPRQTAVKTPTIVSPDPTTRVDSVHPKKRMTGIFGTATSSSPESSPPPPVPSFPLPGAAPSNSPQQPRHVKTNKAYPPPHTLKPKGSSPTLGNDVAPSTTTTGSPTPPPRGPRPHPVDNSPSSTVLHSAASTRRQQPISLLSTPVRGPPIRLRAPSTASQTSSVYSQESDFPASAWSAQPSPPVLSTVAALRRMNSAVSNVSGTSNASGGGGDYNGSPGLDRFGSGRGRRGSVIVAASSSAAMRGPRHRRRGGNAGSRNYLGLLEVGKRGSGGSKLDVVVWDEQGRDKENKKEGGGGGRDGGEEKGTPRGKAERRAESRDSLGLYDEDGFLISSPVRGGES